MVPSITYLDRPGDRIVPGVCIGSDGPVASVALFHAAPMRDVRSIALDTSSRTSVVLTRILCARRFEIAPDVRAARARSRRRCSRRPTPRCVIGDPALFVDAAARGAAEDRPGRGVDGDDGPAVRLGVLVRPAGRGDVPRWSPLLQEAGGDGHGAHGRDRRRLLRRRPGAHRASARRYLRENLMFRADATRARRTADVLSRGGGARAGRRRRRPASSSSREGMTWTDPARHRVARRHRRAARRRRRHARLERHSVSDRTLGEERRRDAAVDERRDHSAGRRRRRAHSRRVRGHALHPRGPGPPRVRPNLEHAVENGAGDFIFIEPGVPHEVFNVSTRRAGRRRGRAIGRERVGAHRPVRAPSHLQ